MLTLLALTVRAPTQSMQLRIWRRQQQGEASTTTVVESIRHPAHFLKIGLACTTPISTITDCCTPWASTTPPMVPSQGGGGGDVGIGGSSAAVGGSGGLRIDDTDAVWKHPIPKVK